MIKETMIAVEFVAEEDEEPHQEKVNITREGEHKTSSTKKRKVKKRLVGSNSSTSIKQMKDGVVRAQAIMIASSSKVSTIQTMTTYATVVMQSQNNPRSDTVLLHYDEA
jgi:hypothetical protein